MNVMVDYFSRFCIPTEILHDLGANLTSELFKKMCSYFGVSQLHCNVSHLLTNTVAERFNGTFKKMLTAFVHKIK